MQGYIININKARDEDLIVTILSNNKKYTTYRFYGARHSTINLGYKIDFELQYSYKSTLPQLRNIIHLATKWNLKRERMYMWQQYIKLFFNHLKDIEEIDKFYFNSLEQSYQIWDQQNPKRVAIEQYINLLSFEGRLHSNFICFKCEEKIVKRVALVRAFLPAHKECIYTQDFDLLHVKELFENKSTLFLNDQEIEKLWQILLEGF